MGQGLWFGAGSRVGFGVEVRLKMKSKVGVGGTSWRLVRMVDADAWGPGSIMRCG